MVKEIENITNTISLREACRQFKVSGASVSRHMRHLRQSGDMTIVPVNETAVTNRGLTKYQKQFLENYTKFGTVQAAMDALGLHRTNHNRWLSTSPLYEREFESAKEAFNDKVRNKFSEILELPATEHIKHPVALIALARSRMAEFADPVTNVVNVNIANLPDANDTQLRAFLNTRKKEDVVEGEVVNA